MKVTLAEAIEIKRRAEDRSKYDVNLLLALSSWRHEMEKAVIDGEQSKVLAELTSRKARVFVTFKGDLSLGPSVGDSHAN